MSPVTPLLPMAEEHWRLASLGARNTGLPFIVWIS